MIKHLVKGNVYRWKPTGETIIFRGYLGDVSGYRFVGEESGVPFFITRKELIHIGLIGSAKLIKMDKRIV